MKSVNSNLTTAIRNGYALNAQPRLIAEWNMNRYFNPTAENYPSEDSEGYDIEMFPIESIVMDNRPTKGIAKARINESTTARGDGYRDEKARYYVADVDDVYKYWTSPVQTNSSGNFPKHTDNVTKVRPHIVYNANVSVNKIVIKFDNYWATPEDFWIMGTTVADPGVNDWTMTIATSPTIAADGSVTLYWNGSGWTSTRPASMVEPPLRTLRGIMVQVDSMTAGRDRNGNISSYLTPVNPDDFEDGPYNTNTTTGANSFFNLIEIAALREVDLSDRLISVEDDFEMSSVSELYPIGTITSNTGTITLSNLFTENGIQRTGYFNRNNKLSPYTGLLEPNVKFNLEYVYTLNETQYPVQQFVMYGGDWQGLVSDEVTIEVADYSKFFNEIYPRPALWSDLSVPEIVQRLLDSVGFVDWVIDDNTNETKHIIPNFWVDGEMNIWEVLDDLAKGTQSAIYFDSFGKLRVQTRKDAFNNAKNPVWTLRGVTSGSELEDIVEINQEDELGANHLTVTYKSTTWSREVRGMPAMDKVWEPDTETVVLRASPLMQNITHDSTIVHIPYEDAKVWPYSGMFEIQGEIFRYNGKRYLYYTYTENVAPNGTVTYSNKQQKYATVKSADELKEINQKTPQPYRHLNDWTGGLALDTEKESRGVWNSEQRNHNVDISGWSVARESGGDIQSNSGGMVHNKDESSIRLRSAGDAGGNDITIATHGNPGMDGYKFFGTQITFLNETGLSNQQAGMVLNCNNNFAGYYVELKVSEKILNKDRAARGEVALFNRTGSTYTLLDSDNFPIVEGLDYDLDAQIIPEGGNHRIVVWVNGRQCLSVVVSNNKKELGGQFATYVRGNTIADFQYFYAIRREVVDPGDDASFFNLKEGGYTGRFWDREWVWGWKTVTRRKKKKQVKEKVKWGLQFFDEFGPIVHEVREYNVKFDPKPVLHSRLYMSNEWTGICTEYRSNPFGAYFVLANAARENAVIHGEDALVFGGTGMSTPINQILTVIGRVLVEQEAETVEAVDEESVRIRGKVESELESNWIQSKAMAEDVTGWMKDHWSKGVDQLSVELFGNPLIEIGDVVTIDYPDKYMTPATHKYFVTSVQTRFESGLSTTLRLRRVA